MLRAHRMRESSMSLSSSHPTSTLQDMLAIEQIETRPASLPEAGELSVALARGSELDLLGNGEDATILASLEAKNSPTEDGIFNLTIVEPSERRGRLSRSSTSSDGSQKSSRGKRTGPESPRRRKRSLCRVADSHLTNCIGRRSPAPLPFETTIGEGL